MNTAYTAIVSGRVQLVMYRDFVERSATKLGLVGEVRNLPDGTVRVVAEGERSALEALAEKLKAGSLLSRVDQVVIEWAEPLGTYQSFSISYA